VTCLARGSQPAPTGTTWVQADRDDLDALASVSDRGWDAIINLTSQPVHAYRAVGQFAGRHWIFVSSGSVYSGFSKPEQPAAAQTVPPLDQDWMRDMSQYGPAKVAGLLKVWLTSGVMPPV